VDTSQEILNLHSLGVVIATASILLGCVLIHYEGFSWLTGVLARLHTRIRRRRILVLIFGLLALHVTEIWLFGFGYLLLVDGEFSAVHGANGGLLDFVYFSAVVYTTLGLGDLIPAGAIRFMTGTEALTGFLLITWSASFTFLEMQKFWKIEDTAQNEAGKRATPVPPTNSRRGRAKGDSVRSRPATRA
jgi:hypothetical protein